MKKKIFLYVGHSNWGKSFVLKHITEDNSKKKIINIFNKVFRVRKMSNDDDEKKLLEFVKTIELSKYNHYIIAFCPRQEKSKMSNEILNILASSGELYFFIQKKKYNEDIFIEDEEINSLKKYGDIEILNEDIDFKLRAVKLMSFIENNI